MYTPLISSSEERKYPVRSIVVLLLGLCGVVLYVTANFDGSVESESLEDSVGAWRASNFPKAACAATFDEYIAAAGITTWKTARDEDYKKCVEVLYNWATMASMKYISRIDKMNLVTDPFVCGRDNSGNCNEYGWLGAKQLKGALASGTGDQNVLNTGDAGACKAYKTGSLAVGTNAAGSHFWTILKKDKTKEGFEDLDIIIDMTWRQMLNGGEKKGDANGDTWWNGKPPYKYPILIGFKKDIDAMAKALGDADGGPGLPTASRDTWGGTFRSVGFKNIGESHACGYFSPANAFTGIPADKATCEYGDVCKWEADTCKNKANRAADENAKKLNLLTSVNNEGVASRII